MTDKGYTLHCGSVLKKYDSHFMEISPLLIIVLGAIGFVAAYINPETINFDNNCYGNILLMIVAAITLSLCKIYFVRRINPLPKLFSFYGKHTIFIIRLSQRFNSYSFRSPVHTCVCLENDYSNFRSSLVDWFD